MFHHRLYSTVLRNKYNVLVYISLRKWPKETYRWPLDNNNNKAEIIIGTLISNLRAQTNISLNKYRVWHIYVNTVDMISGYYQSLNDTYVNLMTCKLQVLHFRGFTFFIFKTMKKCEFRVQIKKALRSNGKQYYSSKVMA